MLIYGCVYVVNMFVLFNIKICEKMLCKYVNMPLLDNNSWCL